MLGESLLTAFGTTAVFLSAGAGVMMVFGYTVTEALIVGIAMTFSSTILGIKLLPTTVLHHRHIGEIVISLVIGARLIGNHRVTFHRLHGKPNGAQQYSIDRLGSRVARAYRRSFARRQVCAFTLVREIRRVPRVHFLAGNRMVFNHCPARHSLGLSYRLAVLSLG